MGAEALLGDDDVHVVEVQHDQFRLPRRFGVMIVPVQVDFPPSCVDGLRPP